jgi:hypothetical protein
MIRKVPIHYNLRLLGPPKSQPECQDLSKAWQHQEIATTLVGLFSPLIINNNHPIYWSLILNALISHDPCNDKPIGDFGVGASPPRVP